MYIRNVDYKKKEWTGVDCMYSSEILHTGVRCDLWKHVENETRQAMYVYRNREAHCSGKAMSITHQSVCICICICSLRYPACNEHAPYCHLWPLWLYQFFPHYLT